MRCFVAIDVEEKEILRKICEVQRKLIAADYNHALKPVEEKNMHITLKFLGEINEKILPSLFEVLKGIKFPRFTVTLKDVDFFPNERFIRVIYIRCLSEELNALAETVNEKVCKLGFEKEEFKGHLTLARVRGRLNGTLLKILKDVRNVYIGEMEVDKIKLKKSVLTPKGPVYNDLLKVALE